MPSILPPTRATVSAALRRLSRPAGAFDAERYFRGDHGLRFYNVGTSRMRALARAIHADVRDRWTVADAARFAAALMRDPYLETKSVGIEVLARYRRSFTPSLLRETKRWLSENLSANWATTDAMCGMLIGPLIADRPELLPRLRAWARDRNMWVRRASIVPLIVPMRGGLAIDQTYDTATALLGDREDLIQKAMGWALREAGKQDMPRLERYLREHGASTPRTTLRYAIERFPESKRRALLAATKRR
jgi:3-methyladenine DNA glycosylase AlkD